MPFRSFVFITAALALSPVSAGDFQAVLRDALGRTTDNSLAISGSAKPWRFLARELKHLSAGDLAAIADFKTVNVEKTDPLPVIADYAKALKELGVELMIVAVPLKAAIYPEKLSSDLSLSDVPPMKPWLDQVAAAGVSVVDLDALFRKHRADHPDEILYCATDSHWSPLGAQLAAAAVAAKWKDHPALAQNAKGSFKRSAPAPFQFHGDLLTDEEKATEPPETLPLTQIEPKTEGRSPVLVIGDSHCQIFRTGGPMLASDGGFIDHLAHDLGMQVEDISSQSSGADQPRSDIARRTVKEPDFWNSRKIVVWLFTAREFTQGKWRVLPAKVVRK